MIYEASGLLKTIKPRENTYVSRVMPHKNTLHNSSGPSLLNSTGGNSASFYDRKENPSSQVHTYVLLVYIYCLYIYCFISALLSSYFWLILPLFSAYFPL